MKGSAISISKYRQKRGINTQKGKLIAKYQEYYSNTEVLQKIVKEMQFREVAFMLKPKMTKYPQIRHKRISWIKDLQFNLNSLYWTYKQPYNVYISCATYWGGYPILPYSNKDFDEKKRIRTEWNKTSHTKIVCYDWLIDIDMNNETEFKYAKDSALQVIKRLEKMGKNPLIRYSGMGFHIVVPSDQLKAERIIYTRKPYVKNSIYAYLEKQTKKFHDDISEMIDYNITDHRRLMKCPYTLAHSRHKSKDIFICTPISYGELFISTIDDFRLSND